jgi:uncharacterized protein (DUF2237 family)
MLRNKKDFSSSRGPTVGTAQPSYSFPGLLGGVSAGQFRVLDHTHGFETLVVASC